MINEKLRMQNIFDLSGNDSRRARNSEKGPCEPRAPPRMPSWLASWALPWFPCSFGYGRAERANLPGLWEFLASAMVAASGSSTPLLAYVAVFVGLFFWPFRKRMRTFRWGLGLTLVALHLVMKAPVWFLIARVNILAGNSGYHRAMLIDQCVRHFWDWWLVGANTANWGWDMWDLSNQFVAEADTGGLATLICFFLVITRTFARIGNARKIVEGDSKEEWFVWFLGVTLFTHMVGFFGISYFDHTKIWWSAYLAIASVVTAPILAAHLATTEPPGTSLPKVHPLLESIPRLKLTHRSLPDLRFSNNDSKVPDCRIAGSRSQMTKVAVVMPAYTQVPRFARRLNPFSVKPPSSECSSSMMGALMRQRW